MLKILKSLLSLANKELNNYKAKSFFKTILIKKQVNYLRIDGFITGIIELVKL